jgi:hypothetical protein
MGETVDDRTGAVSKIRETYKQAKSEFRPAVISAGFYTLVGIAFGFLLLAVQHGLEQWSKAVQPTNEVAAKALHFIAFMFEHLGIGFVVAAIAVFFYEWGAHIKKTMELTNRLVTSIDQVAGVQTVVERAGGLSAALGQTTQIMESLHLTERLYKDIDRATRFNLTVCLSSVIGGTEKEKKQYLINAAKSCEDLIRSIEKLRKNNHWANNKYIEFITKQIDEVVGHNADAFSHLRLNHGTRKFKVPPTAAGMAADILAHQMEAMKEGDRYDVISDLTSWRDTQLDELFNKTEAAVTNDDVQVRRVFNFLPYAWRGYDRMPSSDHRSILVKHLQASETWRGKNGRGSYKIKILWPAGYETIKNDPRVRNINIATQHFGLFIHGNVSIKFSVTKIDLSDMEMCRQDLDNDDSKIFTAVWTAAEEIAAGGSVEDRVSRVYDELAKQRGIS